MSERRMKLPMQRGKLTLRPAGSRLEIGHEGPKDGSGGYDWSCLQLSPSEARDLAPLLKRWADGELANG